MEKKNWEDPVFKEKFHKSPKCRGCQSSYISVDKFWNKCNNTEEKIYMCYLYERVLTMIERQIKLPATEDVKEFVTEASRCDFDIDVFYNRVVIDAKSILGVFSMDLTRVLTVKCFGRDEKFLNFLNKYAVA